MRKIFKSVFAALMWLWSRVYTYKVSCGLIRFRNMFYTMWIRNFIGELPQDSSIAYPCCIQGGGLKYISIGHHTGIQSHSILGCWVEYGNQQFSPSITIGSDCHIGEYNQITACNKITIGDGLLTGRFVYIGDNGHGGLSWEEANIPPAKRNLESKGEIKIGNNVWIGDKVTILGGVTIGDNVIVGANSVVTHNVPSNSVAVGMPAKIIKELKK